MGNRACQMGAGALGFIMHACAEGEGVYIPTNGKITHISSQFCRSPEDNILAPKGRAGFMIPEDQNLNGGQFSRSF